jgi:hypothetical protein
MLTIPNHKGNEKNTFRFYLTPVRMPTIQNTATINVGKVVGDKGTLLHCCLEYKLLQLLWKVVWRPLKKLKIEQPYTASIPFLGVY